MSSFLSNLNKIIEKRDVLLEKAQEGVQRTEATLRGECTFIAYITRFEIGG